MKKQIIATCVALGLGITSAAAFAAPAAFQANVTVTGTSAGQCALLQRDIRLGVSAKVHGAYDCDEVANLVKVAACHEGGSRTGVTCAAIPVLDAQGNQTGVTFAAGCTQALADEAATSPVPSYKAFFASSNGGTMLEQPLDGRCTAATITGIEGF